MCIFFFANNKTIGTNKLPFCLCYFKRILTTWTQNYNIGSLMYFCLFTSITIILFEAYLFQYIVFGFWEDLVRACCRAVRIAPFSNRLAQSVPSKIQGLRCFANFGALRFSEPIRTLAESMVDRMVKHSSQSGGKYVSVHLRFEEVL